MDGFVRKLGRMLGVAAAVLGLAGCAGYRTLEVSVLEPGRLELEKTNLRVMFLDRKLVHESDERTAADLYRAVNLRRDDVVDLYRAVNLRRDDVVDCLFDGLRDGLRNGARPVSLTKGLGLSPRYIPDDTTPAPLTAEEIRRGRGAGAFDYVLGVEYCDFRLDGWDRIYLDDNVLLRLYRVADGKVVDEVLSDTLGGDDWASGGDDYAKICNFFYGKGWAYAERMVPTWRPAWRRVYLGNRVLSLGNYYFEREQYADARTVWTAALEGRPLVAVKAAVNLAWLYEREENYAAGAALLEAALRSWPGRRSPALRSYVEDYLDELRRRVETEDEITNQL